MKKNIPILLSSSVIAYDNSVALTDMHLRIQLTIASIHEWLKIDASLRIVVCDGSNYDFSPAVRHEFPGALIECLYFQNDQQLVREFGRGYGEGEIVKYAINNSKFIDQFNCFAKCSAKLWVTNFLKCADDWNGFARFKAVFSSVFSPFYNTSYEYVDTRFYIVSLRYYRMHLENAHHAIDIGIGYGLEQCFHDVLVAQKLNHYLFNLPPIICGVGGGTGISYNNSRLRIIKEKIRLNLVKNMQQFRVLF
jgi:hypothetical protein